MPFLLVPGALDGCEPQWKSLQAGQANSSFPLSLFKIIHPITNIDLG
jgi:hypothetical protein